MNTADLCVNIMDISTKSLHGYFTGLFIIIIIAFCVVFGYMSFMICVISPSLRFLRRIPGLAPLNMAVRIEEKAGWWRHTTTVIELVISWSGKMTHVHTEIPDLFGWQTWRKLSHQIHCGVYTGCIFIGHFTSSSSSSYFLLFFNFTSLRQGSDMLIVKIIFFHPECSELDKDGCAVRASW